MTARVASFLEIKLKNGPEFQALKEKHVNHSNGQVVVKETKVDLKMDVLLLGFLDNPMIKCMR